MPLNNPSPVPERILSMGGAGSGKTNDFFKIADWAQRTGSDAKFHLLDTDMTGARMLATDYAHLANVEVHMCFGWEDLIREYTKALVGIRMQDWISIDLISPTWDWVQEYYTAQIFKEGVADFFMQARLAIENKEKKEGTSAFDGWKDWGVINKLYRDFTNRILRSPCNVYATAVADTISKEDEHGLRLVFGPLGVKPKGQKHTSHIFHTVLLKKQETTTRWVIVTAKDRGREYLQGVPCNDFVLDYLVKVAGWKVA